MIATTYPAYNDQTEGLEVAEAFANNITGRTVLITGVSLKSLGYATAQSFASQNPALIIVAGRNISKLQESIDALKLEFPHVQIRPLQVDLSHQDSVRKAADEVLGWSDVPKIDLVINSAGVMCIDERTLTSDGIEMHFATNHIGHWLLTNLIISKIIKAAENAPKGATRIINYSSASPTQSSMRWSDMTFLKKNKDLPVEEQPPYKALKAVWGYTGDLEEATYLPYDGYTRSKVANLLAAIGYNSRLLEKHGVLALAVNPGLVPTELQRSVRAESTASLQALAEKGLFKWKTQGAGAATCMVASLDPQLATGPINNGSENHGVYLTGCQIDDKAKPLAVSSKEADKLWRLSEGLVGEDFTWS